MHQTTESAFGIVFLTKGTFVQIITSGIDVFWLWNKKLISFRVKMS